MQKIAEYTKKRNAIAEQKNKNFKMTNELVLMVRKQYNNILFGGQGSGKTILLLEMIIAYQESNPEKRQLLILPDDSEEKFDGVEEISINEVIKFEGIKKIIVNDLQIFDYLYKWFVDSKNRKFKGQIIMDDAGVLLDRRNENVLNFMRRRRQANADIITVFHGLRNELPPSFFAYTNKIVLFQTGDTPKEMMKLLPPIKQEAFLEVYDRVQREAEVNPYYKEEFILRDIK